MSANLGTAALQVPPKLLRDRQGSGKGQQSQSSLSPEGENGRRAVSSRWRFQKLGSLALKIGSGSTPRGGESVYQATGIPLIRSMNVHFSGFKRDGLAFLDEVEAAKLDHVIVQKNDVLLNITGASIGRVTTVPEMLAGARVNQHVCIIRPNGELFAPFLAQFLSSPEEQARVMNVQVGATRQALTKSVIENWSVPVPPLPEQQRIVAEIEKQFTRLEAGVAALRRVQANLKRYRAAVLKAACEGRLVPTEAELACEERRPYEPGEALLARILIERRLHWQGHGKYKEPLAPQTTKPIQLPEGWVLSNIEQLRVFSLYGPRFSSDDYAQDGYLVLRTTDISESGKVDATKAPRLRLSKDEFERYRAKRGDLLVTRTGSLGTLAIFDDEVEAIPGAYLIQFRLATEPATTRYLFYFLKSPIGQNYLTTKGAGVGRPNLNAPTIEALPVPLPPLAEQKRIVAEVERRLSVVEELEAMVSANLQRAMRLRQSILQKAFIGALDCSETP